MVLSGLVDFNMIIKAIVLFVCYNFALQSTNSPTTKSFSPGLCACFNNASRFSRRSVQPGITVEFCDRLHEEHLSSETDAVIYNLNRVTRHIFFLDQTFSGVTQLFLADECEDHINYSVNKLWSIVCSIMCYCCQVW